ncbi:hypothetical protein N7470_009695 [Penicillium chermesinum]|nr:hypothetical protein N7470_009695 [Penicillium chermesinum]
MATGTPTPGSDYAASPPLETGAGGRSLSTPGAKPNNSPIESRANSLGPDSVDCQDGTGSATVGRKRKLNSTSARGVANLTPDQLAKKRANDRQAQRAIRERTKGHIEALEQQVRVLSSQKPFLDLQAALQQNERVRAENKELRQGLQAAMDIIRPLLARPEIPELPTYLTQTKPVPPTDTPPLPSAETSTPAPATQSFDKPSADSPASLDTPSPTRSTSAPTSRRNSSNGGPQASSVRLALAQNIAHGLDFGIEEKLGFNFLLDPSQNVPKVDRLHRNSLEQARTAQATTASPLYPAPTTCPNGQPLPGQPLPAYATPREAAQGIPRQKLVGPPYPSVSSLLNPEKSAGSHPVSKVFTDILRTFPDISSLPDQVAILYVMFLLMRWQIYPTQENYDRLPDWLTPRATQLLQPHPAWIDYLPFPRMRDRLVASYQDYPFENWFIPFTRGLSVNWPYEDTDCLLVAGDSDEFLINPVFERHLRNLSNWSLGPLFAECYPGLVDTTVIRPDKGLSKRNGSTPNRTV